MKTKLLAIIFGVAFTLSAYKAQVSLYSFTQTAGSYGNPSTGTLVGAALQDDDVTTVTLPFSFTFNGTANTSIDVSSNGCISFNILSGSEYFPISDNSTQDLISAFGQDLFMGTVILADMASGSNTLTNCTSVNGYSVGDVLEDYGFDFGGTNPTITAISANNIVLNTNATNSNTGYDIVNRNGYIKQSVSGSSPNRIFELEFRNFTRFSTYDEVINFKLRLFETSNVIEFVYGNMIPGIDTYSSEVGLKGITTTDFNSRKLPSSNLWASSVASSLITDACGFSSTIFPVSGQSYKWTPVSCNTPTLSAVQSSSAICAGQSATITVSGATTYSWVNGPASAQLTVNPNTTTTYTVIGANSSCTSALVVTQTVTPNPTLSIAQSTLILCAGQSATLTASGASTYSWVSGPNTAQYVISPSSNTTYTLNGSNGNCSSSLSITQSVTICTGINETNLLSSRISVYPNPFNTEVLIKNDSNTEISISVIDALGKVQRISTIKSFGTLALNTEDLVSGLYFVKMSDGNSTVTKKIVKN